MKKLDNSPRCGICATKLVKNGKTSAGKTRWRCKHCGASTTQRRPDSVAKAQFTGWLDWLLSKKS
ncbi:MAG TPA: IS256 family transposase, partial [Enteractinococcus helveticum]|nr:IS256 family transposase [Enteractinococcus helveticum]